MSMRKLEIIGIGVVLPDDLSIGTLKTLKTSDCIFTLEDESFYKKHLKKYSHKIINLQYLFDKHKMRKQAHKEAVELILKSVKKKRYIVFMLGGHPSIACFPVRYLKQVLKKSKLKFDLKITPGVSSIDYFFSDLAIDPVLSNMQISFGENIKKLSPSSPAVILCPGYSDNVSRKKRIVSALKFTKELRNKYGERKRFIFYKKMGSSFKSDIFQLDDLLIQMITQYKLGHVMVIGPVNMIKR